MSKASSGKTNPGAFALEFVGSLIYLALVYVTSSGTAAAGSFATAIVAVWLPLLYAVGVLSAVSLFILSFTNLIKNNPITRAAMMPACAGGFAFVAMTAGNPLMVVVAIIGFVIASAGAIYAKAMA